MMLVFVTPAINPCVPWLMKAHVVPEHFSRHANSHFEDDEVQRDMELAKLAAVAELSTSVTVVFSARTLSPVFLRSLQ
jgi:hypothetical protein